jgi:hypothetical protein
MIDIVDDRLEIQGGYMADKRTNQSSDMQLEEDREEQRRESEEAEQQDLNQGMDTGTHDSNRHGVDWGPSYRGKKGKASAASKPIKRPADKG